MTVNTQALSNNLSRDLVSKQPSASSSKQERPDAPDFADLMRSSNADHQKEMAKLKATSGEGGELKFGETKDDKAFKEMLQRVTGQKPRESKNKLEKEDFLNLMVTQLKYQDPTKPADHKDMASQLAQFNTVEQLASANKSLDAMNQTQLELKADKLTEFLGKEVTAKGNIIRLRDDSQPAPNTKSHFEIGAEAGSVVVTITNEKGEAVKNLTLGRMDAGEHDIPWDGTNNKGEKVGPGLYKFEITAQTVDGKKITAENRFTAEVTGVSQLSKGGKLETALGEIEAKDIAAIRKPGTGPSIADKPKADEKKSQTVTKEAESTLTPSSQESPLALPSGDAQAETKIEKAKGESISQSKPSKQLAGAEKTPKADPIITPASKYAKSAQAPKPDTNTTNKKVQSLEI